MMVTKYVCLITVRQNQDKKTMKLLETKNICETF